MSSDRTHHTRKDSPNGRAGVATGALRRHNLSAVLERLHLTGPLPRSELTMATGLNRSTIADLIGELNTLGLVEEGPAETTSGPGRPSPLVRTRPHGAAVLAIEVAVDSIAVATVGLGGHVYDRVRVSRPRGRFSPQETAQNVAELAGPLLASLPTDHVLRGVGVAVAGIVRRDDGFVHLAPNLGWRNAPLGSMLAADLDLGPPLILANEADLGALAEHQRGVGVGVQNLIYVSGEVGIGTGLILDGDPLLGSAGYAGEAGHTLINPAGGLCNCGASGCWETEAGEAALLRRARVPSGHTGLAAVKAVAARADAGDEGALRAIADVGYWLGLGIGNLVNLFNPELVVLGGIYHRLFPFLEQAVRDGAGERTLEAAWERASIVASGLGEDAVLVGASELAFSQLIADPAGFAGGTVDR